MINEEICTVKDCENFRSKGDLLFCFSHRHNWKVVCKDNGIEDTQIDEDELNLLLETFQGKISLKEFYEKQGWGSEEDANIQNS